jgi:hypothetical protein
MEVLATMKPSQEGQVLGLLGMEKVEYILT